MILDEFVFLKKPRGKSNIYYKSLGYDLSSDEVKIYIKDLPKNSKSKINVKCDFCGKEKSVDYYSYCKVTKDSTCDYACSDCASLKYKKTCLSKWGVENYFQTNNFKDHLKEKNKNKYGVEYHTQLDSVKEKIKNTVREKYKVDNVSQLQENKDKVRRTNILKFGYKSPRKNFKIDNHKGHIEYLENSIHLFKCEDGHEFEISNSNFYGRLREGTPLCTICNPIGDNRSIKEKTLFEFIQSNYNLEVVKSYRDRYEIDIYLPDIKLGVEFNGLYWHSDKFVDKNYHYDKTKYFNEKGIDIFHVWEDDWVNKQDIVKSMILNKIGKTTKKIFARKCLVREIKDTKIVKKFLNDNHIQGFANSKIKIGLFHNGEIVSLMTFDQFEGRKKMDDREWNINRFCNKINHFVIGGASKMISFFKEKFQPIRIISYADKNWSSGNLYQKLGFRICSQIGPDYKYLTRNGRSHKSGFRKSLIGISESDLKIPKIWDCGKIKFEIVL